MMSRVPLFHEFLKILVLCVEPVSLPGMGESVVMPSGAFLQFLTVLRTEPEFTCTEFVIPANLVTLFNLFATIIAGLHV